MDPRNPKLHLMSTEDLRASGATPADIRREVRAGRVVRIRRGWYCEGQLWAAMDAGEQHVVRAAAVASDTTDAILCGETAARLWGIPLIGAASDDVELLTTFRGGGKSEPGVRRTVRGAEGADVVVHRALRVTSPAWTAVDIACRHGFTSGVVAMDWLLAAGVSRDELDAAVSARRAAPGHARARSAVAFADARAESAGESVARAAFFEARFAIPELQFELRDSDGVMRLDFWWPDVRVAAEFDGRVKYGPGFTPGVSPEEAVWREKKREDRVRRQARRVVRLTWADVMNRSRVSTLLAEAGVSRCAAATEPRALSRTTS